MMENEQHSSGTCPESDDPTMDKAGCENTHTPCPNSEGESNHAAHIKDQEQNVADSSTSHPEVGNGSPSCVSPTKKADVTDLSSDQVEFRDNLDSVSTENVGDFELQSSPSDVNNPETNNIKGVKMACSKSVVLTEEANDMTSSQIFITKLSTKEYMAQPVLDTASVEMDSLPRLATANVHDSCISHNSITGTTSSIISCVTPAGGASCSVSDNCKMANRSCSDLCPSTAGKLESSSHHSHDAVVVEETVNNSQNLPCPVEQTCSSPSSESSVKRSSDVSSNTVTLVNLLPSSPSASGEVCLPSSDSSTTNKMHISPVCGDGGELEHPETASVTPDGTHTSASCLSIIGEPTQPNVGIPSKSDVIYCNKTEACSPQSFSDSKHEPDAEFGAEKIELDEPSVHGPSVPGGVERSEMPDVPDHSQNNNAILSNKIDSDVDNNDSLSKKSIQGDSGVEHIQNNVSLSVDVVQSDVCNELDEPIHSCAFEEPHSENSSISESSKADKVSPSTLVDTSAQDYSKNVLPDPDKEATDKIVDGSATTLNSCGDSRQLGELDNKPMNDLAQNSPISNQDSLQDCFDNPQKADLGANVDDQPKILDEEDSNHSQPSQCSGSAASKSNIRSEKLARSPKELLTADSESNSWDNSYSKSQPVNPPSSGSTHQLDGSVPGSLADTESSNLSFASSSTSTTQPLDMGDIIKAGMDTDPVLLPEATSNVKDGSDAQLAVDQWCFQQADANKQQTEEARNNGNVQPDNNIPMEYEDSEFDWEEYMEDTNSAAAPDAAFPHVEASLRSNFDKGMKFEVAHGKDNKYWIATVVMPCGQLLRLRYDGSELDHSKDFWCDAFTSDIHPLGWCRQNEKVLEPPDDLKEKFPDWHNYVQTTLAQATTASDKLLGGVLGTAAVDQIKQSMLVEVQDENDLTHVWIARVLKNIGGRLLLRYEGTDSARQDFWLFYLHYRIHPMGWAQEMDMPYGPPEAVAEEWSQDKGWKAVLEKAQNDAKTLFFPADVLADQEMVLDHAIKQGWRLEALHPITKNQLCPATIVQVFSDTYFLVQIDDHELSLDDTPVQMCCHGGSRNIFPIGWTEKQGLKLKPPHGWQKEFDWQNYLREMEAEPVPPETFSLECDEVKLAKGMKLEAANPEQPGQICVATVLQVSKPLVLIHLECGAEQTSYHMVDYQSQEIFPVGWCESNSYPLQPPNKAFFTRRKRKKTVEEPLPTIQKPTTSHSKSHHGDKGGIWCPKIYFNHRCFSGPYLSKGRIAELPKSVGPGPVTLVMKEVMSMLINVAYKSSRVLRELQMDGDPDPSLHQQVLKAKYKGKSYRAVVELCKTTDQVEEFCKNICVKLECCPYLFSPTFINGQCPENCSQQSKTKYTAYVGKKKKRVGRPPGGHSNLEGGPKKAGKRRKRKRIGFFKVKKSLSNPDLMIKDEEMDEFESVLHEESSNSTTASLELVLSNGIHRRKRKYTRHVAPPLEMKTRGVKLPRYSIERRTRQPRLQLDSSIKAAIIDNTSPVSELQFHQGARKSAFVVSPVKQENNLVLDTNPLLWSVGEVVEYIKTTDCAPLARLFKEEEIDGQALLLLTLPTVQELMEVKLGPAIKLCHLIEKLKIAFYEQYAV